MGEKRAGPCEALAYDPCCVYDQHLPHHLEVVKFLDSLLLEAAEQVGERLDTSRFNNEVVGPLLVLLQHPRELPDL